MLLKQKKSEKLFVENRHTVSVGSELCVYLNQPSIKWSMTDAFVTNTIKHLLHETHVRKATEVTLNDIVFAVEQCSYENEKEHIQHELQHIKSKFSEETVKVQHLEKANKALQSHRVEMRQKANQAKEHFIVDISQVLRESRNIYSLRERLKEMDKKLLLTTRLEAELVEAKKRVKELERQQEKSNKKKQRNTSIGGSIGDQASSSAAISNVNVAKVPHNLLVNVEDSFLMSAFSYLSTKDVIHTAQASRYLYKKVDTMFSIGSALCKQPDWGVLPLRYTSLQTPPPSSTSSSAPLDPSTSSGTKDLSGGSGGSGGSGSGIVGLTKQMAEELSKKLSAPELKTILSMMDNQKKLSSQLQTCQAENAQRKEQLEVSELTIYLQYTVEDTNCSLYMCHACSFVFVKMCVIAVTCSTMMFFHMNFTRLSIRARRVLATSC